MAFFETAHLQPYGAIAWGKDDALELDSTAMYCERTGRSFEDLHPTPWPELAS